MMAGDLSMTIFELAETLPNGFHDAEVQTISLDYRRRTVNMQMEVWIGTMDDPEAIRETYRRAEVTVEGFHYCALDLPDERYPFDAGATLTIDLADATAFESPGPIFRCRIW